MLSDAAVRQLDKLLRLADHLKIDRGRPDWGVSLALRIAADHHPGFRIVYDDAAARMFHRLHGSTPLFPLKGKPPKPIGSDARGWAAINKMLPPEFLAMLIAPSGERQSKLSDLEICEALVKAADPEMKKRPRAKEMDSRAATLNRKLTEGRKSTTKNK